ncbi:beta-propeller domain-containing protein [Bacillus sp. T33-2]|uniref:beta-propeller domain-containing protein n=1 Tax=Bacillus sp. T33-2 TaxID=2054168 RepID=UPI000C76EBAA|nr:beta-propeller domain-containing protein [Bacillus sp. T33-2]PLR95107.1 hypothetical protein CVD19_15750 [Bacillus sp. T33-2]
MKKIVTVTGLLLLFAAVIIFYSLTQLKIVNAWDDDEKQIVLPNKVWRVTFTEKIDEKSIKPSLVYVTNEEGVKQSSELTLSDDKKTIYISPPKEGYESNSKIYLLHIKKGIKSVLGRGLISSKRVPFVVEDTLPSIGSKSNLNDYFLTMIKEQKKQDTGFFASREDAKVSSGAMFSSESAKSDSVANNDVSQTNVQVQGVDEADMVKTDGKHIFQAVNNKIDIIQALPAGDMKHLSQIPYDQFFNPSQLFLHDDKLLVIGQSYKELNKPIDQMVDDSMKIAPMHQSTKAIVYDVKNPEKPAQIREIDLEGSYLSARKIGGAVYLVSNQYPDYWLLEQDEDIDIRPKYSDTADGTGIKTVEYRKIQYIPDSRQANYIMIAAFNLDEPKKKANITTYLGGGDQMYMSEDNLYLAVTNHFPQPNRDMSSMVAPDTNIYKFSVDGMNVKFHSSAEVQGTVLNQFSMDEHEGHFRLVTTKGYAWDESRPSSNQLYILDGNLKPVGQLEELARGERIYSARFMGDRIYMVTFKETDPLFVINASEPARPKVLGELKIPGFSNYLHPYDENHIIGFGQDTKVIADKGFGSGTRILTDGVKISMFDVSDMSNPKEKFTEIIGGRGTYSPLNQDHKALLFNKNKNLFAFPVTVYHNQQNNEFEQTFAFQGAYIYNIDLESGFNLKSKISHGKNTAAYDEWESSINRLLYIGDTLYALSPEKITAHDMQTFGQIGELLMK